VIHGVAGHVGCMADDPLPQELDVVTATRIAPSLHRYRLADRV